MSLISDAIKAKQRERNDRVPASRESQPLLDGFFPYVSSSPARVRSRRAPLIIGVGATLFAAIAAAAYFLLAKPSPEAKAPIVLPPPISQAPMAAGSPIGRTTDTRVGTVPNSVSVTSPRPVTTSPSDNAPRRTPAENVSPVVPTRAAASRPAPAPVVVDAPTREATPVRPATSERGEAVTARIDYEAQATALFNAGDMPGARDKFQLATRFAPTARAWTNYGVTLQKLGDVPGATAAYQSAIGIDANYLEAWLYHGRLAVQLGDVARAVPMFQRARSINPRHSDVNVELARLESEAKNWTETRRFAEDAVRGDPSNARAHWYFAVSTDQLKDFEIAAREYAAYLQTVGAAERDQAQFVGYARARLVELRGKP